MVAQPFQAVRTGWKACATKANCFSYSCTAAKVVIEGLIRIVSNAEEVQAAAILPAPLTVVARCKGRSRRGFSATTNDRVAGASARACRGHLALALGPFFAGRRFAVRAGKMPATRKNRSFVVVLMSLRLSICCVIYCCMML